jgi:hypothetical protein
VIRSLCWGYSSWVVVVAIVVATVAATAVAIVVATERVLVAVRWGFVLMVGIGFGPPFLGCNLLAVGVCWWVRSTNVVPGMSCSLRLVVGDLWRRVGCCCEVSWEERWREVGLIDGSIGLIDVFVSCCCASCVHECCRWCCLVVSGFVVVGLLGCPIFGYVSL